MKQILNEISFERSRQDLKWGEQNHSPADWLTILVEEVGEAAKAALETKLQGRHDFYTKYRIELVHVAAVAVAAIECLDRGNW